MPRVSWSGSGGAGGIVDGVGQGWCRRCGRVGRRVRSWARAARTMGRGRAGARLGDFSDGRGGLVASIERSGVWRLCGERRGEETELRSVEMREGGQPAAARSLASLLPPHCARQLRLSASSHQIDQTVHLRTLDHLFRIAAAFLPSPPLLARPPRSHSCSIGATRERRWEPRV